MAAYRPDRSGRGDTPAARRRARRRALTGVDPAPTTPKKVPRPKAPPRKPVAASARAPASASKGPAEEHPGRPWFEWRGWDSVITYVVLAVMLAGVITGLHRLLAAGVLVIGASALAWAVTHRPGQRRTTSSYGVLLDWLMNVLPRPLFLILFLVLTALGIIGVIVG
ncbi:MAG TPA: hypothetical protein VHW96_22225 [Solirubrobacteraceae bacterium]|jgi:hypothetical protein|nr:hypothetical protein [Solirubrobacteraceae bacterium]